MQLFKGGLSKCEYDDAVGFGTPVEIPGLMKTTKIEFSTPTEENALNKAVGAGKAVKFTIESEDLTAAVYTELIAAEEAHTPMFFKFTGLKTSQNLILKSCTVVVDLKPEEGGKNWKRVVSGTGFADTEANLMALTL
ncbi:MAG: hypothetical protein HYV29_08070 [Ignavibacteriales bacterium]|nr:hypothetical protein [Ignavibacteriales bacterium]